MTSEEHIVPSTIWAQTSGSNSLSVICRRLVFGIADLVVLDIVVYLAVFDLFIEKLLEVTMPPLALS